MSIPLTIVWPLQYVELAILKAARGPGCDGVPTEGATWGRIKSMYF